LTRAFLYIFLFLCNWTIFPFVKQIKTCFSELKRFVVGQSNRQNYNGKTVKCAISEGQMLAYVCRKLSQVMGRVKTDCNRSRTVHHV